MHLPYLHKKLIAAARADVPSDHVPLAFEQRVMARLRERPVPDGLTAWAQALWRAAAPCVAVAVVLGLWSVLPFRPVPVAEPGLAQALEETVYAAVEQQLGEDW